MKLIRTTKELKLLRKELKGTVGLVPTMGNLHAGHMELIKNSLKNNQYTIVTIFVNPTQFGEGEDLESYPRTLEQDKNAISNILSKEDRVIIFAPNSVNEIYPKNFQTKVEVTSLSKNLCGTNRPGHFSGVTTVVYLLFALTKPTNSYFGEKDFQQLTIIKQMVKDLMIKTNIVPVPIVRDSDGLAKSSRNNYLSKDEREQGLTLPKTIKLITSKLQSGEEIDINRIVQMDKSWDYLEILDSTNLEKLSKSSKEVLVAGAYQVGKTRLIDNCVVKIT